MAGTGEVTEGWMDVCVCDRRGRRATGGQVEMEWGWGVYCKKYIILKGGNIGSHVCVNDVKEAC